MRDDIDSLPPIIHKDSITLEKTKLEEDLKKIKNEYESESILTDKQIDIFIRVALAATLEPKVYKNLYNHIEKVIDNKNAKKKIMDKISDFNDEIEATFSIYSKFFGHCIGHAASELNSYIVRDVNRINRYRAEAELKPLRVIDFLSRAK